MCYEENESKFLTYTSVSYCFSKETHAVFLNRFSDANQHLSNKQLADKLADEEILPPGNPEIHLRDHLKKICNVFEKDECDYQDTVKGKWTIAKKWLRDVKYPEWLRSQYYLKEKLLVEPQTIDQLWQKLRDRGSSTDRMGAVLAQREISKLGARHKLPSSYLRNVPLNSDIQFQIDLDNEAYLILLEREPSGAVYCLCPSEYAPNAHYRSGKIVLPQFPPSPYQTFATNELGLEQWIAVISNEALSLDWLEQSQQEALELKPIHLQALIDSINHLSNVQIFYTNYRVIGT